MQTAVVTAIALIPVYVIVLSVAVNVFLYKNRPAFRDAFISPSHRIPATIRYLLPYPFSAYGWKKTTSTTGNVVSGNRGETRQRAELRPVTLPPVTSSSGTNAGAGTATGGSTSNARSERVITRGGRRWGRTGSQRSTRTLPLYSEDVGDEDVVLIAKRESMRSVLSTRSRTGDNDGDIVEEEEMEDDSHDESTSQNSESRSTRSPGVGPPSTPPADQNPTTQRERSHSIISSSSIYDRGWGEAPAYEDVMLNPVDPDLSMRTSSDTVNRSADIARTTTGGSQDALTGRPGARDSVGAGTAAGFRSFVNRLTGRSPANYLAGRYSSVSPALGDAENGQGSAAGATSESFAMTGRARGFSNASSTSQLTVDSNARRPSATFRRHPGIATNNNSLVSLLLHPTMSNQSTVDGNPASRFHLRGRSGSDATSIAPDLSSPSASVVNLGISPPIPGTVIRSAYIQPRAGFSSEQLKFLSSTESLGKFGANFGPEDAGSGLLPSSQLNMTRSRSGSASSVGAPPLPPSGSHRRIRSSSSVAGAAHMTNDGLPSFEDLIREEAVAEEQRRRSSTTNLDRDQATRSLTHPVEETPAEDVGLPPLTPDPNQNTIQIRPSAIQVSTNLPNFDLEVVPPTPIVDQNRRSFMNGRSLA